MVKPLNSRIVTPVGQSDQQIIDVPRRQFVQAGSIGLAGVAGAATFGCGDFRRRRRSKTVPPVPKRLEKWRSEGQTIELMGTKIWYHDQGPKNRRRSIHRARLPRLVVGLSRCR